MGLKNNEFAIIVENKIVARGVFSPSAFLKAFRIVYQRNFGVPDELIIDDWIKSFSKPLGWDKYDKGR